MVKAEIQREKQNIPIDNGKLPTAFNGGVAKEHREHSEGGIKFFFPEVDAPFKSYDEITADYLRQERKVWRPEETIEAARTLFQNNRLKVIGDPDAGKGTILFGLSEIFEGLGQPYAFFDGHYQDTPYDKVVKQIKRANNAGAAILFDAFDHLLAKSRSGIRTITVQEQKERTPKIIEALLKASVPVVITFHDETWQNIFLNPTLKNQFDEVLKMYPEYEIPLNFRSEESIYQFLTDNHIPKPSVDFLLEMRNNPLVINSLIRIFGDKEKVSLTFEAIRNYPVLKGLARTWEDDEGRRNEVLPVLNVLARISASPSLLTNEVLAYFEEQVGKLAYIILEEEHRRVHMTILRKMKKVKR